MKIKLAATIGVTLAAGAAGLAIAADPADPALKGLADCQGMTDVTAKAACYDAATTALSNAVRAGEIIIVKKKEAQAAQRGAFGFNLPSLNIFDRANGRSEKDDKGDKAGGGKVDVVVSRPLDGIDAEAKSVRQDNLGHWIITTTEGATWTQIDNEVLAPRPKAGSKLEIKRAALGSYVMKVDGHRPIRVRRSE